MLQKAKIFLRRKTYRFRSQRVWKGHLPEVGYVDKTVNTADGSLRLRSYLGKNDHDRPLIIYFHGGGWAYGDLETHHGFCKMLCAQSTCSIVSVDYRLAPEHPYPAAADDCLTATDWIAGHIKQLGPSNGTMILTGDSAGANLATATCLELEPDIRENVAGEILIYPVTDHYSRKFPSYTEKAKGYRLTSKMMSEFWDTYLGTPEPDQQAGYFVQALPLQAADVSGLPPTLLITADNDPLRDEGVAYAEKLQQAGVSTEYRNFIGTEHGFACTMGPSPEFHSFMDDLVIWLDNLNNESEQTQSHAT